MAFWGAQVTETKAAVVEVPAGFVLNVCNATSATSNASDSQLSLGLETQQLDGKAWKGAVAHVGGASQPLQVKLDLVFGHKVKFYVAKGSGVVNLTGYFQPGPSFEEEVVNEESDVATVKKSKKRAREDKKNWDEVSSSSDSEDVLEKKAKSTPAPAKEEQKKSKPVETPAKKEEQKKPKQTEATTSNGDAPACTSQKKKRKKNKHKKQVANGEAK